MASEITTILEIGTGTIRVLIAELRDDDVVSVVGVGEAPSRGISKGEIVNRDDAISCVRKALKSAEESCRKNIHSVILVTSGGEAACRRSMGTHKLVDFHENMMEEVCAEDIDAVVDMARRVALPENRIKLHTIQQRFYIDDSRPVSNPVGMQGENLHVNMLTIHGKRSAVENFRKLVDDTPIACSDAVFSGLCSALAVVSEEQKKAGVLVIDIGCGTTDYALYHDGYLQAAGSFSVG
ncbi:MAG TPA: cell division protein FtsA, partial [Pontiella sp.]